MIKDHECPGCGKTLFETLKTINVGADGKAISLEPSGIAKCANCGVMLQLADDGSLIQISGSVQEVRAITSRVRSSVSAADRNLRGGPVALGGDKF